MDNGTTTTQPTNPSDWFNTNFNQKPFDTSGMGQQNTDFFNNFSKFIPQNVANVEGSLNLPQMRENYARGGEMLNNLQSSIFNIPNTVADTSRNSLLNEGQRASMVNAQTLPLNRAYGQIQQGQTNLGEMLKQNETTANQQEQANLLPWEKQYDAMTRQQAANLTGYTDAAKNELSFLISKMNAGMQWTNDEANRANQLALLEKQNENALVQIDANTKKTNPYMDVPAGGTLFNILTGQQAYQAPGRYTTGGTGGGGGDLSSYVSG